MFLLSTNALTFSLDRLDGETCLIENAAEITFSTAFCFYYQGDGFNAQNLLLASGE